MIRSLYLGENRALPSLSRDLLPVSEQVKSCGFQEFLASETFLIDSWQSSNLLFA